MFQRDRNINYGKIFKHRQINETYIFLFVFIYFIFAIYENVYVINNI